ncbi:MAG: hypothetical protein HN344_09495, partial [Gammaproteobacteria bacterium]|nr:hypothetical protein [Gammaproteobacteria bacterium]
FDSQIDVTSFTLLLGFGLLLSLLVVQMTLSYSEIESQRNHMSQVVDEKIKKNNLVQTMLDSAQERGTILTQIYYEDDPFQLDEMAIRFSNLAGIFMSAREQLTAMELTHEEFDAQESARQESGKGTEIFQQVFKLALSEQWAEIEVRERALDLLQEQAIPACRSARNSIKKIRNITEASGEKAIEQATAEYQETQRLLWLLGAGIFLLSALIVFQVYRRVTAASHLLQTIHQQMGQQVCETVTMFNVSIALIEHSILGRDESTRRMIDQLTQRSQEIHQTRTALKQLLDQQKHSSADPLPLEAALEQDADAMEHSLSDAIVTLQDFDRISQQLKQVINNLNITSALINDPSRIYDPEAWAALHQQIQSTFVMEDAQTLYEDILHGSSIEEALKKAQQLKEHSKGSFELF